MKPRNGPPGRSSTCPEQGTKNEFTTGGPPKSSTLELGATAVIGAAPYERCGERTNLRNGHRARVLDDGPCDSW